MTCRLVVTMTALVCLVAPAPSLPGQVRPAKPREFVVSEQLRAKIAAAVPQRPAATPAAPRKVLVYGRMPTHPESVACCFEAMVVLGRKTGAFEATCSGDPEMFAPETLRQFDAILMNNTHEKYPLLPADIELLPEEAARRAREREPQLQRSFLEFVRGGKGLVGIHGAVAGQVRWPEYLELFAASYGGHFTDTVWVKPLLPSHPLCASLAGSSFQVLDEIYLFKEPYAPEKILPLLSLDLEKMPDPGKRPDRDYPISWIRSCGQGRVFYCSLGHASSAYVHPAVLNHYLAGIQYAIGDLKADPPRHQ